MNGLASTAAASAPTPSASVEAGELRARGRFPPRRWHLALAVLVILSGSGAAAAVLSGSAPATPHVVPDSFVRIDPRSGKIISVAPLAGEPQGIAVTPKGIWTNNLTENAVSRYDLRTHRVLTLGTPPDPFAVVANARNAWVSSLRSSSRITRFAGFGAGPNAGWGPLDHATSTIHLTPPGATALALGDGYLWAIAGPKTTFGQDDRVWLIDPASNRIVRQLRLGRETDSIAFGDGAAWIGAFGSVRKMLDDPQGTGASWLFSIKTGATGPRKRSYRLERGDTAGPSVLGMAIGDRKVWVLTCGACNHGVDNQKLLEFDPDKWKVVKRIPLGQRNPNAVAFGGGFVWLASQVDASLLRIDPKSGRMRTIPVGNPRTAAICGMAATGDAVWLAVGNRYCESTGG